MDCETQNLSWALLFLIVGWLAFHYWSKWQEQRFLNRILAMLLIGDRHE